MNALGKRSLKTLAIFIALAGALMIGHGEARADEVTISGLTTGTVTGIPQLTFTGNPNFTNTTMLGIGALSGDNSLGTFFLSASPGQLVTGRFNLLLTFTSPTGILFTQMRALNVAIQGSVSPNPNQGGINLFFEQRGGNFSFQNETLRGSFSLFVADLFVETGQSASLTAGIIADVEAVPEPATLLLLGTGLIGIAAKVRKRRNAAKNRLDD